MILIDTHTHLYLEQFDKDRKEVVSNAIENGVQYMMLPNIDSQSVQPVQSLCSDFPEHVFGMMGLHPTSVGSNYREEMNTVEQFLDTKAYIGVGECGIDLYWDKTFVKEQEICFRRQIRLAHEYRLPLIIHSRESNELILDILESEKAWLNGGIFHCFSGNEEQAKQATSLGFHLGIGGVISFKNSTLLKAIQSISPEHFVLETDSPFLAPVPHRGKRNESAYISIILKSLALVLDMETTELARITTKNALDLFQIK